MSWKAENFFRDPDFDYKRFQYDLEMPPAERDYVIYFTPRSGSSWLTDVLAATNVLGRPGELFNPNHIKKIATTYNANALDRYVEMLRRKHQRGNCFGFEVTIYQLRRVFGCEENFLRFFPTQKSAFYLRRNDIVLQAVSLAKKIATSVAHSHISAAADVRGADKAFRYDADYIGKWLDHIFDQECKIEAFFSRFKIDPIRLSYEMITAQGAQETARFFLENVQPDLVSGLPLNDLDASVRQTKIGTALNEEYAERFRKDRPGQVDRVRAFRDSVAKQYYVGRWHQV